MTKEEMDFIGGMNMCDEISNEAYKKIVCNCEEQEPCEDTISRKAAIDAVKHAWAKGLEPTQFLEKLQPVSPARSIGRWIPVSERLPEKDGWYLAFTEGSVISVLRYCEGWNCYGTPGVYIYREFEMFDVVAWMELPEPYHEDCMVGGD